MFNINKTQYDNESTHTIKLKSSAFQHIKKPDFKFLLTDTTDDDKKYNLRKVNGYHIKSTPKFQ